VALSLAYALLGQNAEAIREANQAVNIVPVSLDAFAGPQYVLNLAQIFILVGEYDDAMDKLEYLMSIPAGLDISVFSLQSDPVYDSLRDHPRFKSLLEKYSKED
jgi:tetratricopeptide (TPR) repeat protein